MITTQSAIYWAHKVVTAGILIVGAYFNVTALFFGMDLVVARFFTTTGEIVLTTWFFAAFVLGCWRSSWCRSKPAGNGWCAGY
jgi:hypothetical protein